MGKDRWVRAILLLVGTVLVLTIVPALADAIYTVTLNTTPLQTTGGSYAVYFQLTDGSGARDGNNTATASGVSFGTGAASGTPTLAGGASGDLASGLALTDSDFFNGFVQGFTPGASLSFTLDLTTNVDGGGVPDLFAMSILDANGIEIPTLDPSGANTLLTITFESPLSIQKFGTDASAGTTTNDYISMEAPIVTPAGPTPVPEPATMLLIGSGVSMLVLRRKALLRN